MNVRWKGPHWRWGGIGDGRGIYYVYNGCEVMLFAETVGEIRACGFRYERDLRWCDGPLFQEA